MRSDLFHQWIQSAGILIASLWGMYTFVWQDILVPSWAPAHINLEIALTPVEGRLDSPGGAEMTLKVTATNPSTRKLYLLSNAWQLYGIERGNASGPAIGGPNQNNFVERGNEALRGQPLVHAQRGIDTMVGPPLAVGRLFDDDLIHPGETINRTMLVRIPSGYSSAGVSVLVPALTRPPDRRFLNGRRLEWGLTDDEILIPMVCQQAPDGAQGASESRNLRCKEANVELDQQLKSFDPLMRIFSVTQEVGLPR